MKEIVEFRIQNKYANLLLDHDEGKNNGSNTIIILSKEDVKYKKINDLQKYIREKYGDFFFLYSNIKRNYSKRELERALLFNVFVKSMFEPAGEECGTIYNESLACDLCGANRKQVGPLILKSGSIPKKDISRTISDEIVVSEKFISAFMQRDLKGADFETIFLTKNKNKRAANYYQLHVTHEIELSKETVAGINVFDLSEYCDLKGMEGKKEIYKCPYGHTIGLNLLSEAYVLDSPLIKNYDLIMSKQKIGVKRGLLRPKSLLLCSRAFKNMVDEEKLTGFDFEIANISEPNERSEVHCSCALD